LAREGAPASEVIERELVVTSGGRQLQIVCTAGQIVDAQKNWQGTVLIFDDITELVKAQHMSVWREVARRIAHEIKNPLTPIQLSAQRLEKIVGEGPQSEVVRECTATIVEHVASIKRLANEFSRFARMPTAEFHPTNLNALISDILAPYAESHPEIVFQLVADSRIPEVQMDAEQIRRVLINLVDNAVAALRGPHAGHEHRIVLKTAYDRRAKIVSFEVADNGPGIKDSDKARIFEPYFTTKVEGSGLGLAIVTSILSDHQGEIRVYDNQPGGAKFIVELPLSPKQATQRRFVAV